eukprot:397496-Hanusia_phi.AAC.1
MITPIGPADCHRRTAGPRVTEQVTGTTVISGTIRDRTTVSDGPNLMPRTVSRLAHCQQDAALVPPHPGVRPNPGDSAAELPAGIR